MKRFLLAGATLLALTAAQPTLAADAPVYKGPAPVAAALFNWSGFYVGVSGGYGWGASRWTAPGADTGEFTGNGGLIGATVGFNWQAPGSPLVLGFEGDLSWANIHAFGTSSPTFVCNGGTCNTVLEWLGTVRGRVGVASGAVLFYATGGVAFGGVHTYWQPALSDVRTTPTGWTAGGGIEAMFAGGWTIKGEYLYVDLGSLGVTCGIPPCGAAVTTNYFRAHILRAGLNRIF